MKVEPENIMAVANKSSISSLVRGALSEAGAERALGALAIDGALLAEQGQRVTRAAFAMALNVVLFEDLLNRVPSAADYVASRCAADHPVTFDHGALRTVQFGDGPTGALPGGVQSFARILEPLGYRVVDRYPLPRLRMTGHAFRHLDHAASIPQFFVSELHVERFDADFAAAAQRVFSSTCDPLGEAAVRALGNFAQSGSVDIAEASDTILQIAAAFGRHHAPASIADYEILKACSAEAAWISTEGNAFNHATDRVADVAALAEQLRREGRPIKDKVEISASGRVRQTALRADGVDREFVDTDGRMVTRRVPGSFYEFISRDIDPLTGTLDLRFDSANATGIFAMTNAA